MDKSGRNRNAPALAPAFLDQLPLFHTLLDAFAAPLIQMLLDE